MMIPFQWPTEHIGLWTIGALVVIGVIVWAMDQLGRIDND